MALNRQIKLSPALRKRIALQIQKAWMIDNPRPEMGVSRGPDNLRRLEHWKRHHADVFSAALDTLGTFSSVNQLDELWPEVVKFVPRDLIDPAKHFQLPKQVAA